jgi:DHA1 family bicyclomycin/chloramphenicol resistance-like MFS transporter
VLGTLTALGALGIDTYLPAFPAIAQSLGVTEGQVQYSLVSYFIALALGQMIYGPLSDRYGRRLPLLVGLSLFTLASVGAVLSHDINTLIAMRFVQGIGACAGMVVPRAVVRDVRSGEEAARLFALMMLVLGVSPIFAPLLGSLLITWLPWQAMFWFLAGFGVLCFASISLFLEETHPQAKRSMGKLPEMLRTYRRLLGERSFMLPVLAGGFSQAILFAYLAASPFIYITLYKVSPTVYSILFAGNAVGLIGLAQANVFLLRRFGAPRLLRFAALAQTIGTLVLLLSVLTHTDSLVLTALCFLSVSGPGADRADHLDAVAGAVSRVRRGGLRALGTIQFACGAISGSLVSSLSNGTALPFVLVITGCALAGLGISSLKARTESNLLAAEAA